MGQQLFLPPTVGGWPTGTAWLAPGTMLARYDFGIVAQRFTKTTLPAPGDFDAWTRLLGMAAPTEATIAALRGFLAEQGNVPDAVQQSGVLILLLSSPEWTVM